MPHTYPGSRCWDPLNQSFMLSLLYVPASYMQALHDECLRGAKYLPRLLSGGSGCYFSCRITNSGS
jgi:hypothetical protein